jgi:uncharacterized protein YjbI with pentapeptide repeats/type II secretory pathway pseudopilin PulG
MRKQGHRQKNSAFSLIEILGACAILLTLGSIAIISTKDMVTAGSTASLQRELQTLNTVAQNFKSAGGVIPDTFSATQVLELLHIGTDLSGTQYQPLPEIPDTQRVANGIPYELQFSNAQGFFFMPANEATGAVFFATGATAGIAVNGQIYPFDITDPEATQQAQNNFVSLIPSSPEHQEMLNAFAAAISLGTLPQEDLSAIVRTLNENGLVEVAGEWVESAFDLNDPAEVADALATLSSARSDSEEFALLLASLGASSQFADPVLQGQLRQTLGAEFLNAVSTGTNKDAGWGVIDFSGVSLSGKNLSGFNLMGANLANLSLMSSNMSFSDLSGTNLQGANLRNANLMGASLPSSLTGADLSNARLASLNFSGINLLGANLAGANLTGTIMGGAILPANLTGVRLNQANLAGADFRNSSLLGAEIYYANLSGSILPTDMSGAVFPGVNFSGQNFSGINLTGTNLNGSNLTGAAFSGATIDLQTAWRNGQKPTLDSSGNGTWAGLSVINWVIQ